MAAPRNPSTGDADPTARPDPTHLAPAIDARAMKAFAHPLRMAMYDFLTDRGSATATLLARHTGESTGQTSYHLRQLERHGFVEEDTGRGSGRERWWRAVGFRMEGTRLARDSTTRPAVETMLGHQVARRAETLQEWFRRAPSEPERWQLSSTDNTSTVRMTAEELVAMRDELMGVVHEHTERARSRHGDDTAGSGTDEDVRRVRLYLDLFPLPHDGAGDAGST